MTIEWILTIIVGGFISAMTTASVTYMKKLIRSNVEYRDKQAKAIENITDASKCLLRDRILQAHNYYMQKDSIDKIALSSILMMYTSYSKLGGNSFVTELVKDLKSLKIKERMDL